MERKQKKDEYYNLKLTNLQSSDENTTHAASPLQMKLKFNNIGGSLEESIHKENSPTVSTARQIAGFTPRQKIVLNEVKGFHEEKDILNSSQKKTRGGVERQAAAKSPSRMLLEEL